MEAIGEEKCGSEFRSAFSGGMFIMTPQRAVPLCLMITRLKSLLSALRIPAAVWLIGLVQPLLPWLSYSAESPNILWLVSEDNGPFLGCYGDPLARTPTLDRLARDGVVFDRCFAQPVCAPSRFTLATGIYAAACGPAEHMRAQGRIPAWLKGFPAHLRAAGYYTANNAKMDYNAALDLKQMWDANGSQAHWRNRPKPATPFFSVFNHEITHESCLFPEQGGNLTFSPTDPARVRVPPYQPDTPEIRADWARYYDRMAQMDAQIASKLKDLEEAGLAENTIVFYYADNGGVLPRSKRFLERSGTHVPLIIYFPPKWQHLAPAAPGSRIEDPVGFVDFAATVLSLAGVPIPDYMQGRAFAGPARRAPREYIVCTRDRMDERYDMMRSVMDRRWLYIRNYRPDLPYVPYLQYMFQARGYQSWARSIQSGLATPATTAFWGEKPGEELYDLVADPDNVHNLASDPTARQELEQMRARLREWTLEIKDNGLIPEGSPLEGYEASRRTEAFPVERVLAMANLAADRGPESLPKLIAGLGDQNEAVRWWAAQGCAMLGQRADPAEPALRSALADESGSVQVAAAEALARLDRPELALPVLGRCLTNLAVPFAVVQAANVLDRLGGTAWPLLPVMKQMLAATADSRGENGPTYVRWALTRTVALLEGQKSVLPSAIPGASNAVITGELKAWHKVTLTITGPFANESDQDPNPFTDYRFSVTFRHASSQLEYRVPGYFAADGQAAETSAQAGRQWRAHLAPDKPGRWTYVVSFVRGKGVALDPGIPAEPVPGVDGLTGSFEIGDTDKTGRDLRAKGRLTYVGQRYLQFARTGEYFLKAGADAPENLLAYADFDATRSRKQAGAAEQAGEAAHAGLHRYQPHLRDWQASDPSWQSGKGKGLIGALNYLAGKGCNAFSFLTYNVGGDGDDVWPFIAPEDKFHYDCSKLDQWQIVFDHAQHLGLYLHFKLQETENDDNRLGNQTKPIPAALDSGDLGPERKLYLRELIARFGYELALNWNLGEENSQSTTQQRAMAQYIQQTDPFQHHIVDHTYPDWQDRVYPPLLGNQSDLTGASLQNPWNVVHQRTLRWVEQSAQAGKPWVVANDEQNPPDYGVPVDPGYAGFSGVAGEGEKSYTMHEIRKLTLWGNLMAGGGGVEYYFGYKLPQNDLGCEDWRSRDQSWNYCRFALDFFRDNRVPFWEMKNADALVGNAQRDNSRFCLAKPGVVYVIYLPNGGGAELDLGDVDRTFDVAWFNPRTGGPLVSGAVKTVTGPGRVELGLPPADPGQDWALVVRGR